MRKISTSLFVSLLFIACKSEDDQPKDTALEAVEAAVWGKDLTQVNVPDLPATATIDDPTTFLGTDGQTHTFDVTSKQGLPAPENPAYPGIAALFEGEGYQMFVTIQDLGKYRLKAKKNGVVLMEGTFSE